MMGVYIRRDSPFYWMLLERPGQAPVYQSTKIPVKAYSAEIRKQNRQDAEDVYAAAMGDLARTRHELPAHDPTTISFAAFAEWWARHKLPKRRGKDRDAGCVAQLVAFFGRDDLTAIHDQRVSEFETVRLSQKIGPPPTRGPDTRRTVSANTVNRDVDVLKCMLRDACPRWLKVSPLRGRKKLRVVPKKKRVLSKAEERRLIEALPPMDQAFYIVSRDGLMRWSNVYDLKWADDCGTHFALDDSKTGPYEAAISRRARLALDSLPRKKAGEPHAEFIFWHRHGAGSRHNARTAWRHMFERACRRAVVPYGREHGGVTHHTATRATGATRLHQEKVDLKTIMDLGNWKDVRTAMTYRVTNQSERLRAVNKISPAGITPHLRTRAKQRKRQRKSA